MCSPKSGCNNNSKTERISLHIFPRNKFFLQPMDQLRPATSSESATIKGICTLFGTFRVGVLRVTRRFKFERDWRYLFIQIKKIAKEGRCSLHLLRGCGTRMYRSFPKNNSKKIRYRTLYLNTSSKSTSWYTHQTTLLMIISEFRSTKLHKNIIYENLVS